MLLSQTSRHESTSITLENADNGLVSSQIDGQNSVQQAMLRRGQVPDDSFTLSHRLHRFFRPQEGFGVWWRQFPVIESRRCVPQSPADRPDPRFPVGTAVRLVGRPERVRRVLRSEWHWHRQQFVFVVETSAPPPFEPYWFAGQLAVAEPEAAPGTSSSE